MHVDMRKVVIVSAADTPNIDSAGAVAEFIPVLPFVVTRVGILVTTAVDPDNSVALTAEMERRITVGSATNAVTLGTFKIMAAAATNLAVGQIVYKDLHIDDEDGEEPEDYDADTSRANRNEAPSSNITLHATGLHPFLIPAGQSFALTLDTNAEADSGAVMSFIEGYYLPLMDHLADVDPLMRDTTNDIS
jgi:hypothetical protein